MKKKFNAFLAGINIFLLLTVCLFVFWGFKGKDLYKSVEVQELIVRSPGSKAMISFKIDNMIPEIVITNENGVTRLFFNSNGLFLKNNEDKIIGSFTALTDGGGGFGLADKDGMASSILRGGDNPSLVLFGNRPDPIAAFGILNQVPHLVVSAENGNEGILLHGGKRSGMMVLDETGKMKVFICKDGIYQGKQEAWMNQQSSKPKYFSQNEDKDLLFPKMDNKSLR